MDSTRFDLFGRWDGWVKSPEGTIKVDDEETVDTRAYLMSLAENLVDTLVETHAGKDTDPAEWDMTALASAFSEAFGVDIRPKP